MSLTSFVITGENVTAFEEIRGVLGTLINMYIFCIVYTLHHITVPLKGYSAFSQIRKLEHFANSVRTAVTVFMSFVPV